MLRGLTQHGCRTRITTVCPDHHGHGAHVDHHRPGPRGARGDRLPHERRGRRRAQRAALVHLQGRCPGEHSARVGPARRAPSVGQRPPVVIRAEFRDSGFTRAHLSGCRDGALPDALHAGGGDPAPARGRASRSSTPTTTASTRWPTSTGWTSFYDAELMFVDRMVEYLVEALPPGAALVITADHGQVDVGTERVPAAPRGAVPRARPVRRGPVPLAARPCGGQAASLLDAARAHHCDVAWVVSRDQILDAGLVRSQGAARPAGPPRGRGPGGPRRRRLRRRRRHRPVRAAWAVTVR